MSVNTTNELRAKFLDFFKSKGHTIIPSAPLVPQNDPSVLFTTAGMHPLVPFLLGEKHPGGKRVANSQKCVRTTDIDDVGDNRHLTFFEMLGNWSFGDYFKDDAIEWSFEFLTNEQWLNIDPALLYVSVFKGDSLVGQDQEAILAWKKAYSGHALKPIDAQFSEDIYSFGGINKIFAYARDKNWWQAGDTGPAGPDTEMFVDTEGALPKEMHVRHAKWQKQTGNDEECHINCDCGRFVEVWNNVFMQFNGLGNGVYEPLQQKNVDTGMGLERITAFLNGQESVFDIDVFKGAIDIVLNHIGEATNEQETRIRIIVDHLRAAVFMVNDGVVPANKQRGYVLRRLLRRAIVHGSFLGLRAGWVEKVTEYYLNFYKDFYVELDTNKRNILNVILEEENKFNQTLKFGSKELLRELNKESESGALDGKTAFKFWQSYGLPLEVTIELVKRDDLYIDVANIKKQFDEEMLVHQDSSRTAAAGMFKGGLADHSEKVVRLHTATHLMQAALRKVLGDHIFQKGSNITAERTRFDFTHPEKMTPEQIKEVEEIVNENIQNDLEIKKDIMTPDEARKLGAIGLFGEKYGETVSVYTIIDSAGNVTSREFCGGPHVQHTGEIGKFKILKEEAVSAGVRRIKAIIEP